MTRRPSVGQESLVGSSSALASEGPAPLSAPVVDGRLHVDLFWSAIAALSLTALALAAPAGLWLLAFLGTIILVHEAGHFVAARAVGMRPTEFFWGFGPEIIAWQHGELRIGLKALFIGGYVKIPGMTPGQELPEGFEERHTYRAAGPWARLATILAGCAVNLTMAIVAFAMAARLSGAGVVDSFGIARGDVFFVLESTVTSLWAWVSQLPDYFAAILGAGEPPVRFASPVTQAQVSGQAVGGGVVSSLQWFAILSCAIGGVNLLPLPPLDGGHAMGIAIERIGQWWRSDHSYRFDLGRLNPVAYATVGALVVLSLSALVLDLRGL